MSDIYTIGEVMVLFLAVDTDSVTSARKYEMFAAGAEANVAIACTRLGLDVHFYTKLGTDELGAAAMALLQAEGINTSAIARLDIITGVMVRNQGLKAPINITYLRNASAASTIAPQDLVKDDIKSARWAHFTGITVALSDSCAKAVVEGMKIASENSVPISFDLNIRRKLWSEDQARKSLLPIVRDVNVLFGGIDEYQVIWGNTDFEKNLQSAQKVGVQTAIMTQGSGKIHVLHDGRRFDILSDVKETVDSVGSGDAFVGGTISGILSGMSVKEAIQQGSVCGGRVASQMGDWTGLPRGTHGRINEEERL